MEGEMVDPARVWTAHRGGQRAVQRRAGRVRGLPPIAFANSGRHHAGHTGRGVGRSPAALLAAALATTLVASVLFAAPALADVRITGESTFPAETQVGDQDIPFRFTVENISTGPDEAKELILFGAGITPACAEFVDMECVQPEIGVFDLRTGPAAAVGVAGSCVGDTFTVEGPDAEGRYRVIPEQPVVLGPSDGSGPQRRLCTFEMLIEEVTRTPTTDVDPSAPGIQTRHQIDARADDPETRESSIFTQTRLATVLQPAPTVDVALSAQPESLPAPGGDFSYLVEVTSTGDNPVTITSLDDDVYGDLNDPDNPGITNNTCTDAVGTTLDAGGTYSCSFDGEFLGVAGDELTNTVTVTVEDEFGQQTDAEDNTTVAISAGSTQPGECVGDDGVEIDTVLVDGPDPVAPGTNATWTVELTLTACEDVTDVTAQGGTVGWATTTAQTDDGTIDERRANRRNRVLLWDVGGMQAGDQAVATLTVKGTTGRKARCGDEVALTGEWSTTATADQPDAEPTKYDHAGPVTVTIAC